jgi:ABC-type branched-subunit amino acid transport system ATPase component
VFVLLIVIVGGSGTLSGPVIGAVIVTLVPELFNASPDLRQIIFGLLLIVLVQALPGGIGGAIKKRFRKIDDNIYVKSGTRNTNVDMSHYASVQNGSDGAILSIKSLTKRFGGLTAVDNLDMTIRYGTIHSLIGPNGAGKTTVVNMITGIDAPASGEIIFTGENITGIKSWTIAQKGIARTYQHVRLFRGMSVIDNAAIGSRLIHKYPFFDIIFRTPRLHREERSCYTAAKDCLGLLGLEDKINLEPGVLSAGQQKLLEIARALCMKPKLLVLDEPCAGLTETEILEFSNLIKQIRATGISVLLVEHHMSLVMDISDDITVLDYGKKIAAGKPAEISTNPAVRKAYLGEETVAC